MAMCLLKGRVITHNIEQKQVGLEMVCAPESGLNISTLWDRVGESATRKCHNGTMIPNVTRANRYNRFLC